MTNERLLEQSIPDRSPGRAFIAIAHAGCRHTKVGKAGVVVWYSELARRILPRPTPTPAGDKPLASRSLRPRYIFSFRQRPSVYNSVRFAGGEPASRLIGGHIPDRSPGHAFVRMTNGEAGMTRTRNGGVQRRARKPFKRIFIAMTSWVAGITGAGCSLAFDQDP